MFYYPPYHATYWNAGNKKKSKKHQQQQQQQQQILQHQQLQQHQSQIPPQLRSQPPSRCQSAASDFLYPRYATASQHQPRRPFPAARQYLLDATYAAGSYQGSYQGSSPTSSDFDEQRLYAARRGIQFPATAITSPSGSHQHQHHLLIHQHNHHHHHQHPLHQQRDLVFDACSDSQASQDGPPSSRDNPTASSVTDQEESDTNHAKQEPAVDDADVEDDADMDDGGEDDDDAAGVGLGARRGDGDAADCNNDDEEVDDEDEEEDDDNRSMRLQMESDERASSVVRLEYEGIYSELRAACGVSQGRCTIPSTSLGISNNCDPVSSPDPSPLPTAAVVSVGGEANASANAAHAMLIHHHQQ
ncbi:unnamed protein product [Notodromas monacha]|uniref:Uncharacterized protein n=1 Tax=Notodromas monacha TaxID=399045 RepID=A0A7R9BTJ4_9CRUS|nr:unnamed protein product [Notodromas monacha]CAG0919940.1 unnamed protein product [Notodromas monacha]